MFRSFPTRPALRAPRHSGAGPLGALARAALVGITLVGIALVSMIAPASAKPTPYTLNVAASVVGFDSDFGADKVRGQFPITSADVAIDFNDMTQTTVSVVLNAAEAQASFPFAAQAMKGPKNLDTAQFPTITFTSTKVVANGDSADIQGMITIRGVTKPLTMKAQLFQVKGEAQGDYTHLTIALSGSVNRSDFGANGWSDMVGDQVRIRVLARIDRAS